MVFTIADLNRMQADEFVGAFGDVAEHSPWVAARAAMARPFADRAAVVDAFTGALRGAAWDQMLAVLRAHPDLAGRAALTADSSKEQSGAGLDRLTQEEFDRFTALNTAYKDRFEIPFIYAVKGATKDAVLASFDERIGNDRATEFANALDNVCRILRFRIEDRVTE